MNTPKYSPERDFLDAMSVLVQKAIDVSTKIYGCVVVSTDTAQKIASVKINGKVNDVQYYGTVPTTGSVYRVFVPQNDMSRAFIITGESNGGGGGTGAVNSVNGKTGDVVLTANDVGALPSTTVIPTKTSQLTNDSDYITASDVPKQAMVVTVTGSKADKTFDEIDAAYKAGCVIQAKGATSGIVYDLVAIVEASKILYFASINGYTTVQRLACVNDSWRSGLEYLVDASRTVNGKSLATNITLTASDVGALPNTTEIPIKTSDLTNDSGFITEIPIATSATIGGVKPITKTSTMTQSVGVDASGRLYTNPSEGGTGIEFFDVVVETPSGGISSPKETTADKTFAEAWRAYQQGKMIRVFVDAYVLSLVYQDGGESMYFSATYSIPYNTDNIYSVGVTCDSDDVWTVEMWNQKISSASSTTPKAAGVAATGTSEAYARGDHVHPKELPTVSASDNGKFLRVVSGAWSAQSISNANGSSF